MSFWAYIGIIFKHLRFYYDQNYHHNYCFCRNLSLTAISGSNVSTGHSRNMAKKDRMSTLKSKGSISSISSYNQHTSNSKVGSKTFRKVVKEESESDAKLIETVKMLKNENK